MPRLSHQSDEVVLAAERDIRATLGDRPLDFDAMLAVSNIYRAATAVRNRMEREVLGPAGLSWGGFTILFVLWVWGDRKTGQLAAECGLAKGTLSGMLSTLERSRLVERVRQTDDGRQVVVRLLEPGREKMDKLFPIFNQHETKLTSGLDTEGRRELARLLRLVTATAEEIDLVPE
jgi:DNA-binding MarR family transcriptional regulator